MIAAFYLTFAAYFEASTHAWQTQVIGVAVFFVCAVGGLFSRSAIAVGYVMHGLWDLSHCLWGSSSVGLSITEIPLGYGLFCSTFDFTVAGYLMISDTAWHAPGKLDLYFLAASLVPRVGKEYSRSLGTSTPVSARYVTDFCSGTSAHKLAHKPDAQTVGASCNLRAATHSIDKRGKRYDECCECYIEQITIAPSMRERRTQKSSITKSSTHP